MGSRLDVPRRRCTVFPFSLGLRETARRKSKLLTEVWARLAIAKGLPPSLAYALSQ